MSTLLVIAFSLFAQIGCKQKPAVDSIANQTNSEGTSEHIEFSHHSYTLRLDALESGAERAVYWVRIRAFIGIAAIYRRAIPFDYPETILEMGLHPIHQLNDAKKNRVGSRKNGFYYNLNANQKLLAKDLKKQTKTTNAVISNRAIDSIVKEMLHKKIPPEAMNLEIKVELYNLGWWLPHLILVAEESFHFSGVDRFKKSRPLAMTKKLGNHFESLTIALEIN